MQHIITKRIYQISPCPSVSVQPVLAKLTLSDHSYISMRSRVQVQGLPLMVQWLELRLPVQEHAGSITGQGAKTPHALQPKDQNINSGSKYCNMFNKEFKNDSHFKKC